MSKETSKTHIRNIYVKLNVNSKSEAIAKANNDRLI
ncbi:MAG: helix-turn-helix transcriptional regulator [Cyclobacteriaceae bacterium]